METLQYTKGGSQKFKRCQLSDAVWDGARQLVATKKSAPKYTYTGWVRCQIQCLPHQVCIAISFLFLSRPPFIYLGLATENDPFKAHNDLIKTRIPT